jgi:HEAT repeat protein
MNKPEIFKLSLKKLFPSIFVLIALMGGCDHSNTIGDQAVIPDTLTNKAIMIVQAGLDDVDPRLRTNAIEVVATAGLSGLMPKVEQLLTDEFVPVRFAAALAIGDTKYNPAGVRLNQLPNFSDENTALAVAYALYMLGDKSKFSVMAQMLANKDMDTRANAALLLGKSGNADAIGLLHQAIEAKDSDDKVRLQAAESLARLKDESIYPKLWSMMLNINADVRVLGVLAMGALGTEQARGALTTQLSDPVIEVRLAAAGQLGMLGFATGEPEVMDVFTKNLTDRMDFQAAERVNCLAALAIGQIKTPALTKFLPKLLNNESKFVQLAAAKAVLLCQRSQ